MTRRHAITDEQWNRIERFFPRNDRPGRPWKDHRLMLDGILWVKKAGVAWRDLPERFGPWQTVYDRFSKWCRTGLLNRIVEELQADLEAEGLIDWELFCIDGTNVRAHRAAAGARRDYL